jgi:hypothetical protein
MAGEVLVKANKIKNRKKMNKVTKIVTLCLFVFLTIVFIILALIYKGGKFIITLDQNNKLQNSIILYENHEDREFKRRLYAEEMPFMDNISIKWLPKDIDTEADGSHNGQNYIAYTFYVENTGKENVNYWYEVVIDDVIKRVDDAVRIMIFVNGEKTVYAKLNPVTNLAEEGTTPFYDGENPTNDYIAVLEERVNLEAEKSDRITIVVWLEGDDPECVNAIIGGEIKMHMNIREEHYEPGDENKKDEKENKEEQEDKNKVDDEVPNEKKDEEKP